MHKLMKRFIDLSIAVIALAVLSPVIIITIIILLFTGEHEVFFRQRRIGYRSRPFYIWKFATMLKNSPRIGSGVVTVRNDPRVTKVGRVLRISKINELPQLFNVLVGEMSLVGPRPLLEVSYKLYPDEYREKIYENKPGITGIGSLVFRDEEKLVSAAGDPMMIYEAIFPYKAQLEIWYLKNRSLTTDLKIIFLTGWAILFPHHQLTDKFFSGLPRERFDKLTKIAEGKSA